MESSPGVRSVIRLEQYPAGTSVEIRGPRYIVRGPDGVIISEHKAPPSEFPDVQTCGCGGPKSMCEKCAVPITLSFPDICSIDHDRGRFFGPNFVGIDISGRKFHLFDSLGFKSSDIPTIKNFAQSPGMFVEIIDENEGSGIVARENRNKRIEEINKEIIQLLGKLKAHAETSIAKTRSMASPKRILECVDKISDLRSELAELYNIMARDLAEIPASGILNIKADIEGGIPGNDTIKFRFTFGKGTQEIAMLS